MRYYTKHYTKPVEYKTDENEHFCMVVFFQGQVEEALKVMHFDRLSIFRPA